MITLWDEDLYWQELLRQEGIRFRVGSRLSGRDVVVLNREPADQSVSWNEKHNKVYVSSFDDPHVAVIDCATDTVLKIMTTASTGLGRAYCDSVNDKVYFADADNTTIRILDPVTDSFYKSLNVGAVGAMVDNGRPGSAHRLFSTGYPATSVAALSGAADSVLYHVQVGEEPIALGWNPVHSWVYVSDYAGSSITVLRDTLLVGMEEGRLQALSRKLQATVVRGVLFLPEASNRKPQGASLLDISGRKVLNLHSGANDIRSLAQAASSKPQVVKKIVVTR